MSLGRGNLARRQHLSRIGAGDLAVLAAVSVSTQLPDVGEMRSRMPLLRQTRAFGLVRVGGGAPPCAFPSVAPSSGIRRVHPGAKSTLYIRDRRGTERRSGR